MNSKSKVYFFFEDAKISIRNRSVLKKFVEEIFKKEGVVLRSINFIFCSDKTILAINKQYLNKNYYTDVITFNLSGLGYPIQAEVYMSVNRIRENAKSFKQSLNSELCRVIFHGILHLCGYNDKKKNEKELMHKKEDYYLNLYFKTHFFT